MSPPLWMSIEPRGLETRLMLSLPGERPALRARLSSSPSHPRALITLLESLSLWYGCPVHAVLDAAAEDVRQYPEKWAVLLGDAPELAVKVEWVAVPAPRPPRRGPRRDSVSATARPMPALAPITSVRRCVMGPGCHVVRGQATSAGPSEGRQSSPNELRPGRGSTRRPWTTRPLGSRGD